MPITSWVASYNLLGLGLAFGGDHSRLHDLPYHLHNAGWKVLNAASQSVRMSNGEDWSFDWDGLRNRIATENSRHIALARCLTFRFNYSRKEDAQRNLPGDIVKFLTGQFRVKKLEDDMSSITQLVCTTLDYLELRQKQVLGRWRQETTALNKTMDYKVMFTMDPRDGEDTFHAVVVTISIVAVISEKKSKFGLTNVSSSNFKAVIEAAVLRVHRDFDGFSMCVSSVFDMFKPPTC